MDSFQGYDFKILNLEIGFGSGGGRGSGGRRSYVLVLIK
jgi:hypothetical protein